MSVILDCALMKFPFSGLYVYCKFLSDHVNEIYKAQGHKPMLMYMPRKIDYPLPANPNFIHEKKYHKFWFPQLKQCKVWHNPFQSSPYPKAVLQSKKIKKVLTIHDLNALHEGKSEEEQQRSLARTQSFIDQSDAIICISNFVLQDVQKNCRTDNKNLYVIYNGAGTPYPPALTKQSYRPSRPFMFGIGYVNRKKNYLTLLPLLQSNVVMEMVIAGRLDEPDYVSAIEEEAIKLGVQDRLKITGPVSDGEKAWYMANCTAFLHPSLAEGFGVTVIEAMQQGKPVFLSRRTSLPEIGGPDGFYFDHYEPEYMQQVYREGMQVMNTTNHKEKLLDRAALFQWHESALQYIAVYNSLQ